MKGSVRTHKQGRGEESGAGLVSESIPEGGVGGRGGGEGMARAVEIEKGVKDGGAHEVRMGTEVEHVVRGCVCEGELDAT